MRDVQTATSHPVAPAEGGGANPILVLDETEIRACVPLDPAALDVVEESFTWLRRRLTSVPPIMMIEVSERGGEVDVKSAFVSGLETFTVKIASGFSANVCEGLARSSGMMVVLDARTGFPIGVLLDNGYLTAVRTAAAGAVAAKHLARAHVDCVGVIGAGDQARQQTRALRLVRSFGRVRVWARRPEESRRFADEMGRELAVEVTSVDHPSDVVRESDLVVTTTSSHEPLVRGEWLHPGLHLTAMGSDAPEKRELHPDVFTAADRVVCDLERQCAMLGELRGGLEAGSLRSDVLVEELGTITAGDAAGRRRDDEITVCDLTGVGVQDTAIAAHCLRRAIERGLGTPIPRPGVSA